MCRGHLETAHTKDMDMGFSRDLHLGVFAMAAYMTWWLLRSHYSKEVINNEI